MDKHKAHAVPSNLPSTATRPTRFRPLQTKNRGEGEEKSRNKFICMFIASYRIVPGTTHNGHLHVMVFWGTVGTTKSQDWPGPD